ncbi:hypothetical protein [Ruicaihuangia caeni]|uniref:hypothetical protein n=1 Tax=Ruicaihuangia caeni TaxID=3042517 RepID=UPI00338EFCE1
MARSSSAGSFLSDARDGRTRLTAAVTGALLVSGLLAGCAPTAEGPQPSGTAGPPPTPTASQEPTAPASPAPTPSSTPEPSTPLAIGCNDLLSLQAVYDFNPNYGGAPDYSPASGTSAAEAVARQGTACGWMNQTSGDTFEVAVSKPSAADLARLTAAASSAGARAQVSGAQGAWFMERAGQGEIVAQVGDVWLVVASEGFMSAGDAEQLATAAARPFR